jgi:hypothetical protein
MGEVEKGRGGRFRECPSMGLPFLRGLRTLTCYSRFFPVCFYVGFRTPNPDEETLNEVKRHLKENELDFNQLVKFDTNHC